MRVSLKVLQVQKSEWGINQVEDAYQPRRMGSYCGDTLSFALSDGAGSISFPSIWAALLVRYYVKRIFNTPKDLRRVLPGLAGLWKTKVRNKGLNWCSARKAEQGSYASLLGFTLEEPKNLSEIKWHAIAIGDTVLFQFRGEKLIMEFPHYSTEDFEKNPVLLSTIADRNESALAELNTTTANCQQGDVFMLMTDALAQWFVECCENSKKPWETLLGFLKVGKSNHQGFKEWVESLRAKGDMRNDDTTLMIVRLLRND
jgi:hypothetical protein